jgi:hypothetical protein
MLKLVSDYTMNEMQRYLLMKSFSCFPNVFKGPLSCMYLAMPFQMTITGIVHERVALNPGVMLAFVRVYS